MYIQVHNFQKMNVFTSSSLLPKSCLTGGTVQKQVTSLQIMASNLSSLPGFWEVLRKNNTVSD